MLTNQQLRILYVEDDPLDQMAMQRKIRNEKLTFELFLAASVKQAQALISQSQVFDVVITDYLLKDGNAFEIFDLDYPAPIIFVTGAGDEEVAVKAMRQGAYDYIIKDTERNYLKVLPITIFNAYNNYQAKARIQLLESSVLNANDAIVITKANTTDPSDSRIIFQNRAFTQLTGFSPDETYHNDFSLFVGEQTDKQEIAHINKQLEQTKPVRSELIYYNKLKEPIWLDINIVPIFNENNICSHYVSVSRDISRKKKNEAALIRAKKEAETAKKAEEHFLAVMSHEIRTPINAIVGLSNILIENPNSENYLEFINSIKTSADNLLALVNDVLDLSKIERGKIEFARSEFNLPLVIKNSVQTIRFTAEAKGIPLIIKHQDKIPVNVIGDSTRLSQILINLLSNAVKFTHEGQVILSTQILEKTNQNVKINIQVIDSGIGIETHQLTRIFEKYKQADENVMVKYGGTGLGLYIVEQLVKLQNGEVAVTSKKGMGSTFSIVLDFDLAQENQEDTHQITGNLMDVRILVGEDNLMNQRIMKTMLENWKASVDVVDNGKQIIQQLSKNNYDVLLTDIQMPEMNGVDTIKYIRNTLNLGIPIIVMTASSFSDKHEAIKDNISDFIQKPFNPNKLFTVLKKCITKPSLKTTMTNQSLSQNLLRYDLSYLKRISNNNDSFVKEMVQIFIGQAGEIIELLPQYLAKKDFKSIADLIHKIRSSARNIGNTTMADSGSTIENLIMNSKAEKTPNLIKHFIEECKITQTQLKEILIKM